VQLHPEREVDKSDGSDTSRVSPELTRAGGLDNETSPNVPSQNLQQSSLGEGMSALRMSKASFKTKDSLRAEDAPEDFGSPMPIFAETRSIID